ncbi:hypothetical protein ACMHYJ_14380 [Castellaniella hirudinis]|uniref:hypothetical protein n=1 Tax=Castellaniella hirudinis TaxID=1144617 RepID=UPI0039C09042
MTTKTDITQERAAFEVAFSRPPFEWEFHRYGEDSAWPGNYQQYEHQCAWEGWQARSALQSQDQEEGYRAMAAEYQRWIDAYHQGMDYEDFLKKEARRIEGEEE